MTTIEELLLTVADGGDLSLEEGAALDEWIAASTQNRDRAILLLEVEASLRAGMKHESVASTTMVRVRATIAAESEALVDRIFARIAPADRERSIELPAHRRIPAWLAMAAMVAILAAGALFALIWMPGRTGQDVVVQTSETFSGTISRNGALLSIRGKVTLQPGDEISVSGGRLTLDSETARMECADRTNLKVTGTRDAPSFALNRGVVEMKVEPRPEGSAPLKMATPLAELTVLGTRFQLSHRENKTELSVTEGKVDFSQRDSGKTLLVTAGNFAVVQPGAALRLQRIAGRESFPADALVKTLQATRADDFVESLGVNIHLHYDNTIYRDFPKVKQALRALGVRHVRDGLVDSEWLPFYERHNELAAAGIRGTFITNLPPDRIVTVAGKLKAAVGAFEGPNEVNLQKWSFEKTKTYQRDLWETVKGSAFAQIPILAPSITDSQWASQLGDLSQWCDYGNAHPYPGGWEPENTARWMRADLPSGMELAQSVSKAKPIFVTETGYQNALGDARAQAEGITSTHVPISEQAAGVYLPRLFLNNYRHGVVRTFWYELMNMGSDPMDPESNFGLFRNDGVSAKPAAMALSNLTRLLADPGSAFQTDSLQISLSESRAQSVLLQKRNGELWLALWLKTVLWDDSRSYGKKQEIDPPDAPCKVTIHQPVSAVTLHTHLDSPEARSHVIATPAAFEITLSERVIFLQIAGNPAR